MFHFLGNLANSSYYCQCIGVFMKSSLLMQVYRLRLLGDYHHSTRIAFVEFVMVVAYSSMLCMLYFYFLSIAIWFNF